MGGGERGGGRGGEGGRGGREGGEGGGRGREKEEGGVVWRKGVRVEGKGASEGMKLDAYQGVVLEN